MAYTYYIRSWDPRSTYPTNPQEGDICYTITLDQTWAPVAGVKKDNLVKEEIYQDGAWVEQGGGEVPSEIWKIEVRNSQTYVPTNPIQLPTYDNATFTTISQSAYLGSGVNIYLPVVDGVVPLDLSGIDRNATVDTEASVGVTMNRMTAIVTQDDALIVLTETT